MRYNKFPWFYKLLGTYIMINNIDRNCRWALDKLCCINIKVHIIIAFASNNSNCLKRFICKKKCRFPYFYRHQRFNYQSGGHPEAEVSIKFRIDVQSLNRLKPY